MENTRVNYEGDVLNNRKDISQELSIPTQNELQAAIENGTKEPFDPVTASHLHWGAAPSGSVSDSASFRKD